MSGRVIVHLAPYLQGGAGRAIATLACAQQRAGDTVIVATSLTAEPGFENYAEYLESIERAGATLITADSFFKRDPLLNHAAEAAVRTALAGRRPALAHAHAAIAARIGMTLGAPVIQTMHGWSRNKAAAHVAEDLGIMRGVGLVAFPSSASRSELEAIGGRFRNTAIVPNGIDVNGRTAPLPSGLADLPRLRSQGTTVLMTIGSLTLQKNHAVVVEALPQLPDTVAVLIGEGPEMMRLSERAGILGVLNRVRFSGYLPDAASALTVADFLIQPSLVESFGLAVVEAFRAGVPVIASRIPALNELVRDTGCGWTFDADAPDSLVTAVNAAISATPAQRSAMVVRAKRLFLDRFTDDRMIAGYDAIYNAVQA